MKKTLFKIYLDVPKLTKLLLPIAFLQHMVISFCLNISLFCTKIVSYDYEYIGKFISLYYFGCLLGALIGGILTLRFNTTKISSIGMLLISGSIYYLVMNKENPYLVEPSMFLLGLVGTIISTSNIASLIKTTADHDVKLKVISTELILFNIAYSLVNFIFIDLSAELILLFLYSLSFILFFTGLFFFFYCNQIFSPIKNTCISIKLLIPKHKQEFTILIGMIFFFGLIFSMVKVLFSPTLIERFGNNAISATIASINPWLILFIQPVIVDRIKNTNSPWYLGFGCLIVGMCYFVFGLSTSFIVTSVALILLTFGEMMFSPLSKYLNVRLYGEGFEGLATGAWRIAFLGSGTIGPIISGYLANTYGSKIVWQLCALCGLTGFLFSVQLRNMKRKLLQNAYIDQ